MAVLSWLGGLALYLVVSKLMYPDMEKMFDGLGSATPLPARAYFAFSARAFPFVAAAAIVAPIVIVTRSQPQRLPIWSRRYALSAVIGLGWGLLAVAGWYLCVSNIISALK